MPRRTVEVAIVALAAAVLAVVMTWPLAGGIDRLGRVNSGDGAWSIWVVAWVARTLVADPAHLYDANIFHPQKNALAFSEANIGAGAMAVPFYWTTRNPLFAHNAVVLIGFALSFVGAYLLARHLTRSRLAAWSAGVAFAYCPFVFARTAHIQLLMTWGLPFCMLAFHRLVARPGAWRGLVLGVLLAVQALSCAYYGIFAGLAVGTGTLYYAWTRGLWKSARYWIATAAGAASSVGLSLPFFLPYLDVQQGTGFARSLEDAAMYSANWQAWLTSAAWAHRWAPWIPDASEVLFPGVITTVAGLAGLGLALGRRVEAVVPTARETAGFYGLVGGLLFWASFGPSAGLYTALFHAIPIFSFLRAPSRFGIMVVLSIVVGLALVVAWLAERQAARWRTAMALLPLALVAELFTAPLTALREAPPVDSVYRMLATLRPGPVVELPFFYLRSDFPRHTVYMLSSTYHWQPLINGYSDHIPAEFRQLVIPLSSFPTRESFALLEQRRARYAIFHLNMYDRRNRERVIERINTYAEYLAPLSREGDVWMFEIVGWPR